MAIAEIATRLKVEDGEEYFSLVPPPSNTADLVILGFSLKKIIQENGVFFKKFENIKDVLFFRAGQKIAITDLEG